MSHKQTILITGGNGMVGSQTKFGIALRHTQLDITNPKSIERAIQRYKPTVIIHLAAMTDLLACEQNPKKAYEVNVIGTFNIAKACQEKNIKLVYLSTCAVFDGTKKTPYREKDLPNPITVYGQTKWFGELMIQDIVPNYLIIRTGWLFGGGKKKDTKFVYKTFEKLRHDKEAKATYDRTGSPTYVPDLLDAVEKLIKKNTRGIVHVVNNKAASYFDVAKAIKKIGAFTAPIIPVKASDIESPKVPRGELEALISSKIKLRDWDKALNEYTRIIERETKP